MCINNSIIRAFIISTFAFLIYGCSDLNPLTKINKDDIGIKALNIQREDFREKKVAFIESALNLNSNEHDLFWKEYYAYEEDAERINDKRVQVLMDYSASFKTMDERKANNLAERSLNIRNERNDLYKKYYERIKSATSAVTAAKFLQIENEINTLIDLRVALSTPLLPSEFQKQIGKVMR